MALSVDDIAYHEAGHAVVGMVCGWPINEISIQPSDKNAGHVEWLCGPADSPQARVAAAAIHWGGLVAQSIYRRRPLWLDDARTHASPWVLASKEHGAAGDLDKVGALVAGHPDETKEIIAGGLRMSEDFLRSSDLWSLTKQLATHLKRVSRMDQSDLDAWLLEAAEDAKPPQPSRRNRKAT